MAYVSWLFCSSERSSISRNSITRVILHVYKAQYLPTTCHRNAMNLAITSFSLYLCAGHAENITARLMSPFRYVSGQFTCSDIQRVTACHVWLHMDVVSCDPYYVGCLHRTVLIQCEQWSRQLLKACCLELQLQQRQSERWRTVQTIRKIETAP